MSTYNESSKTVSHRFKKYIDNVVALKMLVDYGPNDLNVCQYLKLYDLRERSVHEKKYVVGLSLRAWKKSKELLNLVTRVYSVHKSGLFWKLKAQPNNKLDEEERILGLLEDFQRAMVKYCNASQSFYDENPELLYSPTLEDFDEILMIEKIHIDFYQNIAIDCFSVKI